MGDAEDEIGSELFLGFAVTPAESIALKGKRGPCSEVEVSTVLDLDST